MNKVRRLPFLILLALVCSSICWSQALCRNKLQEQLAARFGDIDSLQTAATRSSGPRHPAQNRSHVVGLIHQNRRKAVRHEACIESLDVSFCIDEFSSFFNDARAVGRESRCIAASYRRET